MADPREPRPSPPAADGSDEISLIRRSQQGDELAFEQLVRRYQPRVFSIISNVLRGTRDVEDLAQQVFVKLYFALPSFRFRSTLATFIYRITVNECYDSLRRRRARAPVDAPLLDDEQSKRLERLEDERAGAQLSEADRLELKEAVARLLARASPEERTLLTLRGVEGFSIQEIAQMANLNVNTVKVKLFRARARLSKWARERGRK